MLRLNGHITGLLRRLVLTTFDSLGDVLVVRIRLGLSAFVLETALESLETQLLGTYTAFNLLVCIILWWLPV